MQPLLFVEPEGPSAKRVFWAKMFIPIAWLVTSICFEIIMFSRAGWGFLPPVFLFSFFLMLVFALVVSCIKSRIAQIIIFFGALLFQGAITLANIGAGMNLGEIFQFENFFAIAMIARSLDSANLAFVMEFILLLTLGLLFLVASIIATKRLRDIKPGYRFKNLVAVVLVIGLLFGAKGLHFAALPPVTASWVDNQNNARFIFTSFAHRENFLRTFGSFSFYTRNLLDFARIAPSFSVTTPDAEFEKSNWQLCPTIHNDEDEWLLNEDYNVLMLLMETVELRGIHPLLTPNLWRIKNMSTWVDGYYAFERTIMSEYVALTGSHIHGNEMWNYSNVVIPQSLPQIFRRTGEFDQIGSFHNWHSWFYRRNIMYTPEIMGFCFIKDPSDVGLEIQRRMIANSDRVFVEAALDRMIPEGERFFTHYGNIAPHSPHFRNNPQVFRYGSLDPYNSRRIAEPRDDLVDAQGRWLMQGHTSFQTTLNTVLSMEDQLALNFPKLNLRDENGNIDNVLRHAVLAHLVGLRDYDYAVGMLLARLENTPDWNRCQNGTVMLIDTTAIILYSDHFNYVAYNDSLNPGGGLLNPNFENQIIGERLSFMIVNPRDQYLRDRMFGFDPLEFEVCDEHGMVDFTNVGRRIERFMSNMDVYATIAHLFGIQTYNRFTLGVSVLDSTTISVGVGFVTGLYFGICFETNRQFQTRDFVTFYFDMELRSSRWVPSRTDERPCDETIKQHRERLETVLAAMFKMRAIYRQNGFQHIPEVFYEIRNTSRV